MSKQENNRALSSTVAKPSLEKLIPVRDRLKTWLGREGSLARSCAAAGLTIVEYLALHALRRPHPVLPPEEQVETWIATIKRDGYCVVPDFIDRKTCRSCIYELERIFRDFPISVHARSDHRIFGVEKDSQLIRIFADEPRLLSTAKAILREPSRNAFVLGSRLDFSEGNLGSGEGWHRDSFVAQFKAILYLTDVNHDNGPFQLIKRSEKLPVLIRDVIRERFGYSQKRFADYQIQQLVQRDPARLVTFTGSAGTLILANTSAIHRGSPIRTATRYALTNYYFPHRMSDERLFNKFAPVLTAEARNSDHADDALCPVILK